MVHNIVICCLQVSEIFLTMEDITTCEADSCDSATCSHCENIMDRNMFFPVRQGSGSGSRSGSGRSSAEMMRSDSANSGSSGNSGSDNSDGNGISKVNMQTGGSGQSERRNTSGMEGHNHGNTQPSEVSTCRAITTNFNDQCDIASEQTYSSAPVKAGDNNHDNRIDTAQCVNGSAKQNNERCQNMFQYSVSVQEGSDNDTIQGQDEQKMSVSDGSQGAAKSSSASTNSALDDTW